MKKARILLLSALLLAGCSPDGMNPPSSLSTEGSSDPSSSLEATSSEGEAASSSSEATGSSSSQDESSSSESSSASSLEGADVEGEIAAFVASLEQYRGHPYEVSGSIAMTMGYLTDADPLLITMVDAFTTTRYEGYVTERLGEISYEMLDPDAYVVTTFVEGDTVYRITEYDDGTGSQEEVPYDEATIETNIAIDFATPEINNLLYLEANYTLPDMGYTLDLPAVDGDGTYAFSYSLTAYEEGTDIPSQVITHDNEMTIENGIIVASKSTVDNSLYAGGVRANWQVSTSEVSYTEGTYPTFEGTLPEIEK